MRTTPGHINGCLTLPVTCSLLQTDSRPSGSRTEEQPRSQLHYRTMILFRQNVAVTVAAALQLQHRVKSALSLRSTCNRDIMMHSMVKSPANIIGARCTGSGSHWVLRRFLVRSGAVGSASVLQAQTPTRRKLLYDGVCTCLLSMLQAVYNGFYAQQVAGDTLSLAAGQQQSGHCLSHSYAHW